jgi:CBS domain-containing protein
MTRATIPSTPVLVLAAQTAEELMADNPVSLRGDANILEAIALMTDRGFSAAPVIDEAGHSIGVLSRTDILIHDREQAHRARPAAEVEGASSEVVDPTRVRDLMTPALFTVTTDTTADAVVQRMCELRVHQLFVVDQDDALVGVISALDIVRRLRRQS